MRKCTHNPGRCRPVALQSPSQLTVAHNNSGKHVLRYEKAEADITAPVRRVEEFIYERVDDDGRWMVRVHDIGPRVSQRRGQAEGEREDVVRKGRSRPSYMYTGASSHSPLGRIHCSYDVHRIGGCATRIPRSLPCHISPLSSLWGKRRPRYAPRSDECQLGHRTDCCSMSESYKSSSRTNTNADLLYNYQEILHTWSRNMVKPGCAGDMSER